MRALATGQIILLILGIIVLAVICYMVYTQYMSGSTQLGQSNCQSAVVSACTKCEACITGLGGSFDNDADNLYSKCGDLCSISAECGKQQDSPTVGDVSVVHGSFCKKYGIGGASGASSSGPVAGMGGLPI